jgi:hypothetical protein
MLPCGSSTTKRRIADVVGRLVKIADNRFSGKKTALP